MPARRLHGDAEARASARRALIADLERVAAHVRASEPRETGA